MNKMIKRSVDILEYAAGHLDGFRISDVMHDLSIPKSSAFDIIYTLINCEMLEIKNERLKTFALGPKTYDIGYQYIKDNNIIDIAIQQKNVQAISFLTDYKMKHFGITKKSFDL